MNIKFACEYCKGIFSTAKTLLHHKNYVCFNNKNKSEIVLLEKTIAELKNEIEELKNKTCAINSLHNNIPDVVNYLNKNNIQPLDIQKIDNIFLSELVPDSMVMICNLAKLNNYKLAIQWIIDRIYYIYNKENPKEQSIWTIDKSMFLIRFDEKWNIDKNGTLFKRLIINPILKFIHNAITKLDISTGFAEEIKRNNSKLYLEKHLAEYLLNLKEIDFNVLLESDINKSMAAKYIKDFNIKTYSEFKIFAIKFKETNENMLKSSVLNAIELTKSVKKEYDVLVEFISTNKAHEYILKQLYKKFTFEYILFEQPLLINPISLFSQIMAPNEILLSRQRKIDSMVEYNYIRKDMPDLTAKTIEYVQINYVSDKFFGVDSLLKDIDVSIVEYVSNYNTFIKYVAQKIYDNVKQSNIKDNYIWNVSNMEPYFIYRYLCKDKTLKWKEDETGLFVKKHFFDANINILKTKCLEYNSNNAIIVDVLDPNKLELLYLTLRQYFAELCFLQI